MRLTPNHLRQIINEEIRSMLTETSATFDRTVADEFIFVRPQQTDARRILQRAEAHIKKYEARGIETPGVYGANNGNISVVIKNEDGSLLPLVSYADQRANEYTGRLNDYAAYEEVMNIFTNSKYEDIDLPAPMSPANMRARGIDV